MSDWLLSFQNLKLSFLFLFILVQIILLVIFTLQAIFLCLKSLLRFRFLNLLTFDIFIALLLKGYITYWSWWLLYDLSLIFKVSVETWEEWSLCFLLFRTGVFTKEYWLICFYLNVSYFIIFFFDFHWIWVLKRYELQGFIKFTECYFVVSVYV